MKLVAFTNQSTPYVGILSEDGKSVQAIDLPGLDAHSGILALVEKGVSKDDLSHIKGARFSVADIQLRAPVPRPKRNIFCVGRNYREHADELSDSIFKGNSVVDQWPIIFSKLPECVIGPMADVRLPTGISTDIDYEAELAVVIGKQGINISREDALSYVYGYTIVNDVTARDVQVRHQQWHLGKSFDTFCPMGPCVVTADALDINNLNIKCLVNDEVRQKANTQDLIFDIPSIIQHCSRGITLYPGDIIATGTPSGVAMGMKPPKYLRDGDVVRVEIDGIGHIQNTFRA